MSLHFESLGGVAVTLALFATLTGCSKNSISTSSAAGGSTGTASTGATGTGTGTSTGSGTQCGICNGGQVCDATLGCVDCLSNANCTDPAAPICSGGRCFACATNTDCPANQACSANHQCRPICTMNTQCNQNTAVCNTQTGACVHASTSRPAGCSPSATPPSGSARIA